MIASFTQTYSDDREMLHQAYSNDKRLIEFKNMCDINIHSFHNCSAKTIDKYKKLNRVNNSIYIDHSDIPYTQTIKELMKLLERINPSHLLFMQDDTFSVDNDHIDFDRLFSYIREHDENFMLNLQYTKTEIFREKEVIGHEKDGYTIYPIGTDGFRKALRWSLDDTPYIATMDIVRKMYDALYCNSELDVWYAENLLSKKSNTQYLPREIMDVSLFMNYNIIGRNTYGNEYRILELENKNILLCKQQ